MSRQELLGAARSCQELRGAARSCQELPGAARSCQELPGAARSCQELPGIARGCPAQVSVAVLWSFAKLMQWLWMQQRQHHTAWKRGIRWGIR